MHKPLSVVNCSRFVSLKYWTQRHFSDSEIRTRCELLSICIFEILNTANSFTWNDLRMLWIALDLYLWNIEHSLSNFQQTRPKVVNCSRFVSLKYWTQRKSICHLFRGCCELLSICIFEILNTALAAFNVIYAELWIALDLYLWNIEHSIDVNMYSALCVVNCSRFVSLKYWTQHITSWTNEGDCCELLSICIFEILNTAKPKFLNYLRKLWIALDLYLWNIEHSRE